MKKFLSILSLMVVCYVNACYAAQYTIPDTSINIEIPDKYKVITVNDSDKLVDILDEIYNIENDKNISKEDLSEEAENILREFHLGNNKMIGIDKENLFRFVITYKPISENFLTNMLVDFKIAKSEQALNKVSDMLFLGDEIIVKSVDKNYINNQSFLVINGINKSERDLLLRMYMMVKKDFALGITGATSKKYFEEDSIALKRIVYGIDIPQEVNVIKSKALDEYRWSMITKNNGTNIYIDFDSIKIKNNKEVDMWVAYEEEETTLVCLNKFYLDSREYSNLSLVKYDNVSGKVIDSYSSRYASREYLIPGSVIEMVFGCAGVYYELNK